MRKAVIFDFGRVISAQKAPSLFRKYEEDLGLAPGRLNPIMFGSLDCEEALLGYKTIEEFWRAIGPELGLDTAEEIDAFRSRNQADESINQGVLNLMRRLHGHYKLAVLSNSPPGLAQWLAEWGVLHLFDVVFCSGDEGIIKPDPTAFEVTLKRLGVKPREAVFIDDSIDNVEAAGNLGLHGIHFSTAEALEDELGKVLSKEMFSACILTG